MRETLPMSGSFTLYSGSFTALSFSIAARSFPAEVLICRKSLRCSLKNWNPEASVYRGIDVL